MTEHRHAFAFAGSYRLPALAFGIRGVTFATNGERAVCVTFREPVKGIDPTGRILHPGATMTVVNTHGLAEALRAHAGPQ